MVNGNYKKKKKELPYQRFEVEKSSMPVSLHVFTINYDGRDVKDIGPVLHSPISRTTFLQNRAIEDIQYLQSCLLEKVVWQRL